MYFVIYHVDELYHHSLIIRNNSDPFDGSLSSCSAAARNFSNKEQKLFIHIVERQNSVQTPCTAQIVSKVYFV